METAMRTVLIAIAVAGAIVGGAVQAQDAALKKCMGCHEMDKKKVGPAFKDLAAKYKDNKDAQAMLVAKIKDGKGHAKIAGSDDELKAAVGAALSAK
jgi:cytochrome c